MYTLITIFYPWCSLLSQAGCCRRVLRCRPMEQQRRNNNNNDNDLKKPRNFRGWETESVFLQRRLSAQMLLLLALDGAWHSSSSSSSPPLRSLSLSLTLSLSLSLRRARRGRTRRRARAQGVRAVKMASLRGYVVWEYFSAEPFVWARLLFFFFPWALRRVSENTPACTRVDRELKVRIFAVI